MLMYKLHCKKKCSFTFFVEETSFCKIGDSFIDCKVRKVQKLFSGKSPSQPHLWHQLSPYFRVCRLCGASLDMLAADGGMCTCYPAPYQELMGSSLHLFSLLLPEKTPSDDSLSGQRTSTVFPWVVFKLSSGWWCMSSPWVGPASLQLLQVKLCGCSVYRS